MLLSFSVENYKSFLNKQTLSMRPPKGDGIMDISVIYGGNASGKSNILEAMNDVRNIIIDPQYKMWPPVFSKIGHGDNKISTFEFEFKINEYDTYRYKISIHSGVESQKYGYTIIAEDLWDISNSKKEILIFSRRSDPPKKETKRMDGYEEIKNRNVDLRKEYEDAIYEKEKLEKLNKIQVMLKEEIERGINEKSLSDYSSFVELLSKYGSYSGISQERNVMVHNPKKTIDVGLIQFYMKYEEEIKILIEAEKKIKIIEDQKSEFDSRIGKLGKLIEESNTQIAAFENEAGIGVQKQSSGSRLYDYASGLHVEDDDSFKEEYAGKRIKDIFYWFSDVLTIIFPDDHVFIPKNESRMIEISKIVENFDVGISRIKFKTLDEEEQEEVEKEAYRTDKIRIKECFDISEKDINASFITKVLSGLYQFSFWHGKLSIDKVVAMHSESPESEFNLNDESDGTTRLIEIASILSDNNENKVYVVDELDRRMHPIMTAHIIDEFLSMQNDKKHMTKQLIFTSHEHTILNGMFDPAEVWTLSRNGNISSLSRVSDIKGIKNYLGRLDKPYLNGKIGGTPKFT